jgi:hypothetical protein
MSIDGSWGYMAGRWAADREAESELNAQARRARKAIASWKEYSEKMEDKFAYAESGRSGFIRLYEAFYDELERVDPKNPLLQSRAARLKIFSTEMAVRASELGYQFDPDADAVVKKR